MNKTVILGIVGVALAGTAIWSLNANAGESSPVDSFQILTAMTDSSRIVDSLSSRLQLTDTQKQQVQAIVGNEKKKAASLTFEIKDELTQLREASNAPDFDQQEVSTLAGQTSQTAAGLIVDVEEAKSQVYAILSPEQRALAAQDLLNTETNLRDRLAVAQSNRGKLLKRISRRLNLTDEQQQKIQDILASERAARQPIVAELIGNWKSMQTLTADGAFDESSVSALAQKTEPLTADLIVNTVRTKSELLSVLTPDQQGEVMEMRNRLRSRVAQFILQHRPDNEGQSSAIGL